MEKGIWLSILNIQSNQALQLTQKASFVLCIALRSIFAQNKGHFWSAELSVIFKRNLTESV
jgi:hypothetical protein